MKAHVVEVVLRTDASPTLRPMPVPVVEEILQLGALQFAAVHQALRQQGIPPQEIVHVVKLFENRLEGAVIKHALVLAAGRADQH